MSDSNVQPESIPRLRMTGIRKRFGATLALDGVDLSVGPGEVHALVGENGAGKSTLMKTLSGAHAPDEGEMTLDGKPYKPAGPLDARRLGVCMIYQELSLAPHLSVMENILLGMEPTAGPFMRWGEVRRRAGAALRELGRDDIDLDEQVSRLSIADRQIVEIARAVAVGCRVLVLDEPTSSLTARDADRLFEMVRRLSAKGVSIVYISHFLEEVKAITQRFTVIRDGRTVGTSATKDTRVDQIIAMMVGRDMSELYPRSTRKTGEVLLDISRLGGTKKPVDASLQLRAGEVLGIAGLVGAGRTEMLRAIFGLDPLKTGQVRVTGYGGPGRPNDASGDRVLEYASIGYTGAGKPADRWRQGMGLVSEDRKTEGLALTLSIADNLTLSKQPVFLTPTRLENESIPWIKKLAVKCAGPGQPIGNLSGGNQQKVAIARLLHHDVDVFLLDEPTRGIDVGSKAQIYQLIDELACRGKAVLMVSSYLPELLGVCDRIAVMCRGVLMPAKPVSETNEHLIMIEATGAETRAAAHVATEVA